MGPRDDRDQTFANVPSCKMFGQIPCPYSLPPPARTHPESASKVSSCSFPQLPGGPSGRRHSWCWGSQPQLFLREQEETFPCIQGICLDCVKTEGMRERRKKEISCRGFYWILSCYLIKMTFFKKFFEFLKVLASVIICLGVYNSPILLHPNFLFRQQSLRASSEQANNMHFPK